ncbi:MAG: hypothetical protein RBR89_06315 [Candidatus Bipolaricaulis sp.]|nr:hypothetical protein [Candidatus Bipolaricaulis sp.]
MKKTFLVIAMLLLNFLIGSIVGSAVGFMPLESGLVAVGISVFAGAFIPAGVMAAGILTEVWTGELIKTLRSSDDGSFLDGLPDYSRYAENDVIHMIDVGGDPDVLINNTTYPIAVQELEDGDAVFSLDKFQTKATPVTDDELYASSYDKMESVKERHGEAISVGKFSKALHALAPATHGTKTPILLTTGANDEGRKRLCKADIIALKKAFDTAQVPSQNRRLILSSDHVADLLIEDEKFDAIYLDHSTGTVKKLYGFSVYEHVSLPFYNGTTKAKLAIGATPVVGSEFQASIAFYEKRVFKATGSTKMYYSEAKTDPQNQRSLVNFRHMFIALPKKNEGLGAIVSAKHVA